MGYAPRPTRQQLSAGAEVPPRGGLDHEESMLSTSRLTSFGTCPNIRIMITCRSIDGIPGGCAVRLSLSVLLLVPRARRCERSVG